MIRDMRELMLDITRYNDGVRRARNAYRMDQEGDRCPSGHFRVPGEDCRVCHANRRRTA